VPELPEVETVVRDLRPLLVGRRIRRVEAGPQQLRQPWDAAWGPLLVGRTVTAIRRRGKWIVLDLDNHAGLVVHLGMTGQFTVERSATPRADHTHLVFALDGTGDHLRFRDIRRFGSARFFADAADIDRLLDAQLGPEPWDLPTARWRDSLRNTRRCLKAVLLDQRVVAGVGNIYADESLFVAKLPPTQTGADTTPAQAERLRQAVVAVLEKAIEYRGSTIRNYVGGSGRKGGYQEEFRVYGRTGEPCVRCRRPIEVMRLAGRSTHYCPKCQKEELHHRGTESSETKPRKTTREGKKQQDKDRKAREHRGRQTA
jgi:formamidopyrimidine-DNA glycosylase